MTRNIRYDNLTSAVTKVVYGAGRQRVEIGQDFAAEQPFLAPLPAEVFDPGLVLTPRVDRSSMVTVRMVKYSVPARFIGRKVRVSLRASEVVVFDGRTVAARHQRIVARTGQSVQLDHYLEVLKTKPGALPGSTALARARESGAFTSAHEAFWAASRRVNGDADGTRELIDVLLLHRSMDAATSMQGSPRPWEWVLSAPTSSRSKPADTPQNIPAGGSGSDRHPGAHDEVNVQRVVSLTQRRLMDPAAVIAGLPPDTRPLPSVSAYDELLAKRTEHPAGTSVEGEHLMSPTASAATITPTLRRRRGLTEQAAVAAVDQACRRLRLPTIRAVLDEALTVAAKEQLSYQGFLAELLLAECDDRDRRSSIRRVKAAGLSAGQMARGLRLRREPEHQPRHHPHPRHLGTGSARASPLCLIGDSGTGKSHLLIGLGTAAAEKGYRVKYTLATRLVNELVEAADEKMLAKTIARYGRVDLLCIDELGYMELDRRGAELLFQVLTEREEKNSIAIASNESFSGWTKTFTDPRLCAAIVDRLTFNGAIIETGTDSYRLAHILAQL